MATHISDIPRPMYAYVDQAYLYDFKSHLAEPPKECLIYGISALPGRAWGLSVLLNNGGLVQHLPVQAFNQRNRKCNSAHHLSTLQVWACYDQDFATHEYKALSEMRVRCYLGDGTWTHGRYWFTAAPYNDHFSRTPDQHKHFNFIWLDCGCLASLPGNRMLVIDPSFTVEMPEYGERPSYRVNTQYWYPEDRNAKFDKIIDYEAG